MVGITATLTAHKKQRPTEMLHSKSTVMDPEISATQTHYAAIWVFLALAACVTYALSLMTGIVVVFPWALVAILFSLSAATIFYGPLTKRNRRLFELLNINTLIFSIMILGVNMNVHALWFNRPLITNWLDTMDKTIGFNWEAYAQAITAQPFISSLLRSIYCGFLPEIFLVANFFALTRNSQKITEFAIISVSAVILINFIFAFFPADNPAILYDSKLEPVHRLWSSTILGIRDHQLNFFEIGKMEGLITFPSFHAIMAITLIYITYGCWLFIPSLVFNVLMLIATPTFGAHFLTDIIMGATITLGLIIFARRLASSFHLMPPNRPDIPQIKICTPPEAAKL